MKNALAEFKTRVGEIQDIHAAQGLLGWDQETYMPPNGADVRAKQMATLSKLAHEFMTSDAMGTLLKTLREPATCKKLDRVDQALVREVGKDYDRAMKLPVTLVQELAETSSKAQQVWVEARKQSHFEHFAPYLEKLVALNRQMADALGYEGSPYNALMDLYEPDLTTDQVDTLFAQLKQELVPLVKGIYDATTIPDTRFLHKSASIEKQWAFSELVIQRMGFDLTSGRLDKALHPFCAGFGPGDVRLTTRLFKNDMVSSLFSSMHEAGHGLYEQGVDPALARTPLAGGASLGIHESQSRMWENIVGRSRGFWKHFLPQLRKTFPKQLEGVTLEQFYRAINRSQPSMIRVESDEVTYNLHIMLRYEIERDLIEGRLAVRDIPAVWNAKMQDFLGITPQNDAEGCLQDVHWAHGSFGYFPTYTLGNLYSVQFFNTAKAKIPNLEAHIAKGNLLQLKTWLNTEIHRLSRVETPGEIVQRVTGEPLNARYFVDYLWEKFGDIYKIPRPTTTRKLATTGKRS